MRARAELTEQERDDLCDAMVDYTATRAAAAPARFDRHVVPTVERVIAARLDEADAQIRDLLEEREELLTEIRRLQRGNHPAGRALPPDAPVPFWAKWPPALALAEALTERDAEHEGGEGA